MRIKSVLVTIALVCLSASAWAEAAWVQDAFPGAKKSGEGRFTWLGFKVYDAALWVEGDFKAEQYSTKAMLLSLTYLRDFKGADIAKRSMEEMAKIGQGSEQQRVQWYEKMKQVFPDVKAGESLAGLHQPGKGIKFFRNGKALADVTDVEFAQAFMAIWLDAKTTAPELRKKLIGQAKNSSE